MIPLRKAAVDTTGRDTRWDILNLNIYEGVYVPFKQANRAEMMEKGDASSADLASSIEKMVLKIEGLTARMGEVVERARNIFE